MTKVIFATSNVGKLKEAQEVLGIEVIGRELPIEESQSLDTKKVALEKARAYYKEIKEPLFVEDVALTFNAMNGLPGTYINDFSKALNNEGLIELLKNRPDKSAVAITTLVYLDETGEYIFEGDMKGTIVESPRGDKGFGWDPILAPSGSIKTLAEMEMVEKNNYSMRAMALKKLAEFLKTK